MPGRPPPPPRNRQKDTLVFMMIAILLMVLVDHFFFSGERSYTEKIKAQYYKEKGITPPEIHSPPE